MSVPPRPQPAFPRILWCAASHRDSRSPEGRAAASVQGARPVCPHGGGPEPTQEGGGKTLGFRPPTPGTLLHSVRRPSSGSPVLPPCVLVVCPLCLVLQKCNHTPSHTGLPAWDPYPTVFIHKLLNAQFCSPPSSPSHLAPSFPPSLPPSSLSFPNTKLNKQDKLTALLMFWPWLLARLGDCFAEPGNWLYSSFLGESLDRGGMLGFPTTQDP